LEPTFEQLQTINYNGLVLGKSPFLIMSVIGQELLEAGQYSVAVVVLESALRIGTCSPKLRGSVFSALSSAYWALNSLDKVYKLLNLINLNFDLMLLHLLFRQSDTCNKIY